MWLLPLTLRGSPPSLLPKAPCIPLWYHFLWCPDPILLGVWAFPCCSLCLAGCASSHQLTLCLANSYRTWPRHHCLKVFLDPLVCTLKTTWAYLCLAFATNGNWSFQSVLVWPTTWLFLKEGTVVYSSSQLECPAWGLAHGKCSINVDIEPEMKDGFGGKCYLT